MSDKVKRLSAFKDPDMISQSYIMPGDTRCLRQVSLELIFEWTLIIAKFLK